MKIRDDVDEEGTPVTWFNCGDCGEDFSVCPAVKDEDIEAYAQGGCQSTECESYDPSRDTEILWMSDSELRNHHKLVDMNMLRRRKKFIAGEGEFNREYYEDLQ